LIGSAVMFIMYFVGYKSPAALIFSLIGMVIVGIPHGFANIITYAMIADTVEYLEWKTGERAEGICFAMQTFINKIGMAVGAFIGVLAYHMAGVTPNNPGMLDDKGKDTLWAMLVLLGAISLLLTAVPLFFYNFTEKRQQEVVKIIAERKAAEGNGDNA
ncbi:MAG TPA: MFS transporter, partial [Clostridia bacterium]|nr:MFS transporter [Clostridia bacterium]